MASESVAISPEPALGREWVYEGNVIMRDILFGFAISNAYVGDETMREQANTMARWAKSILTVARVRGDDPADNVGTFDDALAGAEFFLHLSDELKAAAPRMKKGIDRD